MGYGIRGSDSVSRVRQSASPARLKYHVSLNMEIRLGKEYSSCQNFRPHTRTFKGCRGLVNEDSTALRHSK